MMMCYNFFVGMCSRCSELIHNIPMDIRPMVFISSLRFISFLRFPKNVRPKYLTALSMAISPVSAKNDADKGDAIQR